MSKTESEGQRPASAERSGEHRWLQRIVSVGVILFLGGFLVAETGAAVYFMLTHELPDLRTVQDFQPPLISEVYDRYGNLIGTHYTQRRRLVAWKDLPRHVILSFLAAEDADFYLHRGLDFSGIGRAMLINLKAGRLRQGASTITQQVVRNLLLSPERTVGRKLREMILAWLLEQRMSKNEILYIYLNLIFFGSQAYGVEEAAWTYFGVPARELTVAQAAMLAGLVQAPGRLSRQFNQAKAKHRQEWVLDQMARRLFITPEEAEKAKAEPIELKRFRRSPPLVAPYFQDEVRREMIRILGPKQYAQGGYKVYTTLDPYLQKAAEDAVARGVERLDTRYPRGGAPLEILSPAEQQRFIAETEERLKSNPLVEGEVVYAMVRSASSREVELQIGSRKAVLPWAGVPWRTRREWRRAAPGEPAPVGAILRTQVVKANQAPLLLRLAPNPRIESALVSLHPQTREVLALVGGYDYSRSVFNRATQSRRPPGSAMKPIVYSAAFSTGQFGAASVVCDCPRAFSDDGVHFWRPKNFDHSFHGPVTLHSALVHSLNVATAVLADKIGIQTVINRAHEMGISEAFPPALAISLGAYGVSLLELTNAYAVFASYGEFKPPRFITMIVDRHGRIVYSANDQPLYVLFPEEAYLMIHLLNHVVLNGTAKRALALGRPSSGKTGTTSDFRDAWYIGFTPELVTGVWVGRDNFQPIGHGVTGGAGALPIWLDYTRTALRETPVTWFPAPEGVNIARLDPVSSSLPKKEEEEEEEEEKENKGDFAKNTKLDKSLVKGKDQTSEAGNQPPAPTAETKSDNLDEKTRNLARALAAAKEKEEEKISDPSAPPSDESSIRKSRRKPASTLGPKAEPAPPPSTPVDSPG